MLKAATAGRSVVPRAAAPFVTNVSPDPFDIRDLIYRPRLQLLADTVDRRKNALVLEQAGNSCTGHAVAAMVNTVYSQKTRKQLADPVSPYMLYFLARRYDEFPGDEDAGSSLRGVLKGWWRHGMALQTEWPALDTHLDLDDVSLVKSCRRRPLGAYYRVDAQRLDDMQSAITELNAIVASAAVHDGWQSPKKVRISGKTHHIITKTESSQPIGGHAFALVGYNEIGFLVQNSWGKTWGKEGFATLPYEDWLESAYDAWVARPGVPQTPFERVERTVSAAGTVGVGAAPSPEVIRTHVLNLGNDGRLSTKGQATSSPAQLRELIASMEKWHAEWGSRDTVLYIHGGLVSEASGLRQVQEQFQWWMNNHIYPIFIVWQSGPMETVLNQLEDTIGKKLPFGAGINFHEAFDRVIEKTASSVLAFAWKEMKDNGMAASANLDALPAKDAEWFEKPGISILLQLLKASAGAKLHIVGHSAGAVLVNGILQRLASYGMAVESLTFMAAASTVESFETEVAPHLCSLVKRFTSFVMNDTLEQNDTCARIYHKSLLYLVSRGFERPPNREVPLVGMQRFLPAKLTNGKTLEATITQNCGAVVVSANPVETAKPDDEQSNAQHHGDFHNDTFTMTAALLRILGQHSVTDKLTQTYVANAKPTPQPHAAAGPAISARGGWQHQSDSPMVGSRVAAGGVAASNTKERRAKPRLESGKKLSARNEKSSAQTKRR
ncbi:MAG: hypothetical protein QOC81_3488 [Thermoanaerobaculia bacterium]|jgi:hypothetical protein|nr:hypothetical protein [Thermoanaerobaculia bacterium]